ncbi:N-acetyltransferase [Sorangium sp. So ce117]|uniref:N-acetyltransferase n=1 Tax=Sorangium sp. So ce117 TaxID=3133277 RepID=UPI003F61D41A
MTSRPVFVDQALSARIEATEAANIEALAREVAARAPARRAAVAVIAGGRAAFVVPHVRLSRAAGLGMSGPVEARDVEALEDFFASRGTAARILVSPFAHPSLLARLGERGFRLDSLDTVLVRHLAPAINVHAPEPAACDGMAARRAAREEASAWVAALLSAFATPGEPPSDWVELVETGFQVPGAAHFLASSTAGAIAGVGAVYVRERVALLFAGGTLAAHRGRGVHRALIDARLAYAHDLGCDLAYSVAEAGSTSQRNLERAGLVAVYSQAMLIKTFA